MPNVGDTVTIVSHQPGVSVWLEVEVDATAGIGDDGTPEMTEFTPQRFAFVLDPDTEISVGAIGGRLARQFASADAENLNWRNVPGAVSLVDGVVFAREWTG